jgi:D-alanine-D-alanine ligase
VIQGGPSPEAEVSRTSGAAVAEGLAQRYESVVRLELDTGLPAALAAQSIDVAFPVTHGVPGEDGTLQGMLDLLGVPYVGSGVLASACAMAKSVAKALFARAGLPVAPEALVRRGDDIRGAAAAAADALGERTVAKPADSGSGLGVEFNESRDDLERALEKLLAGSQQVLVEPWVVGREITVGVFDDGSGPIALPVIEITTPGDSWYDYEHRYTVGLSEHVIPAPVGDETTVALQDLAVRAHTALGCRDLSRADFVLPDDGRPTLLEVNTLPGFTPTSLYPDAAASAGIEFPELVSRLVEAAVSRG